MNNVEKGRKLYSFVHWDISHTECILQELRAFGFMLLVAIFVALVDSVTRQLKTRCSTEEHAAVSLRDLANSAVMNFDLLRLWQFSSLLLALVFIPWSYFFWDHIVSLYDVRYLPAAIGIHLIWLCCWYQATRPLVISLQNWRTLKLIAVAALKLIKPRSRPWPI